MVSAVMSITQQLLHCTAVELHKQLMLSETLSKHFIMSPSQKHWPSNNALAASYTQSYPHRNQPKHANGNQ